MTETEDRELRTIARTVASIVLAAAYLAGRSHEDGIKIAKQTMEEAGALAGIFEGKTPTMEEFGKVSYRRAFAHAEALLAEVKKEIENG